MSKATIVFADGSKKMAHNLDDLRERWILKRNEYVEQAGLDEYVNQTTIDYSAFSSLEQAREWYFQLVSEAETIEARIAVGRIRGQKATSSGARHYILLRRAMLIEELAYKRAAQRMLRQFLKGKASTPAPKEFKAQTATEKLANLQASLNEILLDGSDAQLINDAWLLFKQLVREGRVEYAPDEQALVDKLRARLQQELLSVAPA